MDFWERVKVEIRRQDTTQDWVAGKVPVSINTLKGWIAKEIMPNADQAVAIAIALGTTVEYLVHGPRKHAGPGIHPNDPWIGSHLVFLMDCKDMHPDQFMTQARVIHFLAEEERQRKLARESEKHG